MVVNIFQGANYSGKLILCKFEVVDEVWSSEEEFKSLLGWSLEIYKVHLGLVLAHDLYLVRKWAQDQFLVK